MPAMIRTVRYTSLVVSGVVSLVAAVLLAERIIRPGIIDDFGTWVLLGLLMLFLLPAATMLALRHDRRQALIAIGRERAEEAAALIAEVEYRFDPMQAEPVVAEHTDQWADLRSVRHSAHARAAHSAGNTGGNAGPGRSAEGHDAPDHTYQSGAYQPAG